MAHFEAKPLAHKNWNGWHISKCNIQLPPARGSPSHRFPTQNPSSRD